MSKVQPEPELLNLFAEMLRHLNQLSLVQLSHNQVSSVFHELFFEGFRRFQRESKEGIAYSIHINKQRGRKKNGLVFQLTQMRSLLFYRDIGLKVTLLFYFGRKFSRRVLNLLFMLFQDVLNYICSFSHLKVVDSSVVAERLAERRQWYYSLHAPEKDLLWLLTENTVFLNQVCG